MLVEDGWKEETAKENKGLFPQTTWKFYPVMEKISFLVEIQWLTKLSLIPSQQVQPKPIRQLPTAITKSVVAVTPGQPGVPPNLETGQFGWLGGQTRGDRHSEKHCQ
jgi:hypothetical protein